MDLDQLRAERDARIESLEHRSRRRDIGVRLPVAIAALAFVAVGIAVEWSDLAYFFSPRTPLILGREGEYRFDILASNRYVQIHGVPTLRGDYGLEHGDVFVVVGLRDTPVLVHRRALPTERWDRQGTPPQPDQRPFAVGGRLLDQTSASRFAAAFDHLARIGEVRPRDGKLWIVLEGERPGENLGLLLILGVLVTFAIANGWFIVRRVRGSSLAKRSVDL